MKKLVLLCLILSFSLILWGCSQEQPQETAHQHNYVQGVCSICSEAQPNYRTLLSCGWTAAGLTSDGEELGVVSLWFYEWGSEITANYYEPLERLDKAAQDYYLKEEPGNLFDFGGKKYYNRGLGVTWDIEYKEQGDVVEITVEEGMTVGIFKMVRTAGNQYTVTEVSGTIINSVITSCLQVDCVFTAED